MAGALPQTCHLEPERPPMPASANNERNLGKVNLCARYTSPGQVTALTLVARPFGMEG
jgi:hypothetical protein